MYFQEVKISEGVNAELSGNKIKVSGTKGQLEKILQLTKEIKIEKLDNKIKISSESERKETKALVGTTAAHIKNMVTGVTKGFTYHLRVVYSHFPVTVKVEGDRVMIQNFLGEKTPRVAKILGNTQVKIEGADIFVSGIDLESVSQTSANMEQATRIVGYDKKIFEDGIWIVSKGE